MFVYILSLSLSPFQPVPSYHEAMANTQAGHSSTRMKSYSPSKVALLSEDYSGGDIPLQDTVCNNSLCTLINLLLSLFLSL